HGCPSALLSLCYFCQYPATTCLYTLSLHDALPISIMAILFRIPPDMAIAAAFIFFVPDACAHLNVRIPLGRFVTWINNPPCSWDTRMAGSQARPHIRSEEHTSELQSRERLVCRLLLEKKKRDRQSPRR